jgi:hypothetical protein
LLFFFDLLPHFDIKSQALKSFAYLGLLVGTPILLLWNYFAFSQRKQQYLGTLYPSIMLIFIINLTPLFIRTSPVPKNIRFANNWKKVNLKGMVAFKQVMEAQTKWTAKELRLPY